MTQAAPTTVRTTASPESETYGRLREGLHLTGYSFERACGYLEWLLEDDRWRTCGQFTDVNAFLDSLRLDKFRPVAEQRKRIANKIKELQPQASNRQIAKTLGVSKDTVRGDLSGEKSPQPSKDTSNSNGARNAVGEKSPPATIAGDEAAKLAQRHANKIESAKRTEQRREESRHAPVLPDGMEMRIGDCRIVLSDVPENSVPLILTDLPWGAAVLYEWLGEFAAKVLIPGGSLICYAGHSWLPRDMDILGKYLRWWWLLTMPHHQSQHFPGKFVIVNCRPVLWYVKEFRRGRTLMPDLLRSPARDKSLHNWSKGDGGVSQVIEHLTAPGELIVDPFAGTGEWGRIAANMGRRWLGADVVMGGDQIIKADPLEAA